MINVADLQQHSHELSLFLYHRRSAVVAWWLLFGLSMIATLQRVSDVASVDIYRGIDTSPPTRIISPAALGSELGVRGRVRCFAI